MTEIGAKVPGVVPMPCSGQQSPRGQRPQRGAKLP